MGIRNNVSRIQHTARLLVGDHPLHSQTVHTLCLESESLGNMRQQVLPLRCRFRRFAFSLSLTHRKKSRKSRALRREIMEIARVKKGGDETVTAGTADNRRTHRPSTFR